MTNSKLHTRFRLVPKSTTLDDLEPPLRTLFYNTCVFGNHYEILNEDRPTVSAAKTYPMTTVYGNIRFMWIFAGVPYREWASNHSGVVENGNFQYFCLLFFRSFTGKAKCYLVPRHLFTDPKVRDLE